ncbi:unnamed protein product [Notodromas monacha]|uniref:Cytochrome b-c1 complex subunit 7 n=1 Tax=Notodromas monacha TaxID=399045 RepID=A0A7R9GHX8_9CRUS|nr:unnamed protein product [Notodromas monacha]CAG0921991.1 unnamed protein product [Notodromas monacha]
MEGSADGSQHSCRRRMRISLDDCALALQALLDLCGYDDAKLTQDCLSESISSAAEVRVRAEILMALLRQENTFFIVMRQLFEFGTNLLPRLLCPSSSTGIRATNDRDDAMELSTSRKKTVFLVTVCLNGLLRVGDEISVRLRLILPKFTMAKAGKEGAKWLKQLIFNYSRYRVYGVYHDDMLAENNTVKEALRRIPAHITDERAFRISRALDLNLKKDILPKSQWTSFEDDVANGRYLQPYLEEVESEHRELQEWNSK